MPQDDRMADAASRIILWYTGHRTDMPWRRDPTPYHVWISEIMLQQTRIEAVLPYYDRFLAAFPDPQALADASDEVLMKLWQGLGYYSRARNLKKAAICIVRDFDGELPRHVAQLRTLPGIGDYTAGAIASIAYGEPEPAVDGNVLRVISRLTESYEDVLRPATRLRVTGALRTVYPVGESAALLTEGLMELGERVCIPNGAPHCEECPVADLCLARAHGTASALPVRTPPRPRRDEAMTILVFTYGGMCAVRRRPGRGLLAGLYEFPSLAGHLSAHEVQEILAARGFTVSEISPIGDAEHVFTHLTWRMTGYHIALALPHADFDGGEPLVYATEHEIRDKYAVPTAFRFYEKRVSELIKENETDAT